MPRRPSPVASLLQEARAMEALADEAEIRPDRLQDYWSLAADLITLVADIEQFEASSPQAGYDEPPLLDLRRRLRDVSARLAELTLD